MLPCKAETGTKRSHQRKARSEKAKSARGKRTQKSMCFKTLAQEQMSLVSVSFLVFSGVVSSMRTGMRDKLYTRSALRKSSHIRPLFNISFHSPSAPNSGPAYKRQVQCPYALCLSPPQDTAAARVLSLPSHAHHHVPGL